MSYTLIAFLLATGIFFGISICFEVGRRAGIRQRQQYDNPIEAGTNSVETAVFALLGLLVAFTFYGAAARFDTRRELIVEEANAIGTSYFRVDLLPADAQPEVRETFKKYVDSRLEFYEQLHDPDAAERERMRGSELQEKIWQRSVAASATAGAHPDAGKLLLQALNSMIDITSTRTMVLQMHPPKVVFALLFVITLIASVLAGNRMSGSTTRNWLFVLAFAGVMAVSVYVILDLEYPRFGLIRVDSFDEMLSNLRAYMK